MTCIIYERTRAFKAPLIGISTCNPCESIWIWCQPSWQRCSVCVLFWTVLGLAALTNNLPSLILFHPLSPRSPFIILVISSEGDRAQVHDWHLLTIIIRPLLQKGGGATGWHWGVGYLIWALGNPTLSEGVELEKERVGGGEGSAMDTNKHLNAVNVTLTGEAMWCRLHKLACLSVTGRQVFCWDIMVLMQSSGLGLQPHNDAHGYNDKYNKPK